ncbi:MAG: ArnT family glycosyltransferase [Planctomycetota bacterium]|jgi:4-amino-4-deoxy-L-arabinose transferase-like glycosyltransferase
MTRKRLLLILTPTVVVISLALILGTHYASKLPTGEEVDALTSVDDSMDLGDRIDKYEPRVGICFFVAVLGVLFAATVILCHVSTFPRVKAWREELFSDPPRENPRARPYVAAALGAAIVMTLLVLLQANGLNLSPEGDEISYLEAALKVRRDFGPAGFLKALYTGQWGESNRHPLYIWALSTIASPSVEFFVWARLLSTFFAAMSLVVAFFVTRRLFGGATAVVVLLLYGLNQSFVSASAKIWCEGLLVSLVTLSVYFTVRGFRRETYLWVAGAFAGLAYLTKLSGLFLPIAFLVSAFIVWGFAALRRKHFYLYFAAFLVTASPLLVRNVVRFGNPFRNYNFSLLWLDSRGQTDTVRYAKGGTGPVAYVREHGPVEIVSRFTEGSEKFFAAVANTSSPFRFSRYKLTSNGPSYPLRWWGGLAVLAVAYLFVCFDADRERRAFVAVLAAVIFIPIAWYSRMTPQARFVVPFLPIILGYLSKGLVGTVAKWQYTAAVVTLVVITQLRPTANRMNAFRPMRMHRPAKEAVRLAEWLRDNLDRGDRYLVGPDDELEFEWFLGTELRSGNVPFTRNVKSLVARSRELDARYIIVSRNLLLYTGRTIQFGDLIRFEGEDMVQGRQAEGMRQVFEDPVGQVDFIVFEIVGGEGDDGTDGEGPESREGD